MRRLIAFIVLAVSLLGITLFNIQSTAEPINWSQEYKGGTEVVYNIRTFEENDSINMASLVETMGNRLEDAGATSYQIDYSVDEVNNYNEVRILLGARHTADINNILRSTVASGELSLFTTDSISGLTEPFERGTAKVLYDNNSQAYVRIEVSSELKPITEKADELGDKLLVLWQGKTEDINYKELSDDEYTVNGETNDQLKNRVLAVINLGDTTESTEDGSSTANDNSRFTYIEDEDKYYITFDAFGYSSDAESTNKMDANSAHSFERILNSKKLDYNITEIYRKSISAEYGSNSTTIMVWTVVIAVVFISAYLLISYGLLAISGIVGMSLSLVIDFLMMNLFNIQVGPAMILSVLVSLLMAVSALMNYYKRTKEEVYNGRAILKAGNEGFRKTISTIIDSTVLMVVLGIVLAVISRENSKAVSLFLLISSAVSVLFVFLLSKGLNNYLLNSNVSEKLKLFNVKKEYVKNLDGTAEKEMPQSSLERLDVDRHGKKTFFATLGGLAVSLIAIIVFSVTSHTFNYSNESTFGRIEVRSTVTEIFEDVGESSLAEKNFVTYLEGLDKEIKVTNSWIITDQPNPNKSGEYYVYLYADLEKPLSVDSEAFTKLEEYVVSIDDSEDVIVASFEVNPGIVKGEFNYSLILVGTSLAIGLVYFLIRYRYSIALSSFLSLTAGTAISLGVVSLVRLEVSAYVGAGILAGLLMTLLILIPFGNRVSQLKNESKVKVTTFEQRKEITLLAFRSYVEQYVVLTVGAVVLLLAFIPLTLLQMAPIYLSCIISLLINSGLCLFAVVPLHLWFEKHWRFTKIKSKRAEMKKAKREKLAKTNRNKGAEPEEIIIPGIND